MKNYIQNWKLHPFKKKSNQ